MTLEQLEKFNAFLLQFTKLSSSRLVTPLFRGETLQHLYQKLGVTTDSLVESNHTELLSRLFLIGDKSRHYFSKEHFGLNRSWKFDINECSEKVFNFIFDTIADCIKRNKVENVKKFFAGNDSFKEYFLDKVSNKKEFGKTILNLSLEKQVVIRNYYLKLLHQIGTINYRDRSHLVSTSRKYSIAKEFAIGPRSNNGVVIHAWQPVYSKYAELTKNGLPRYTGQPYRYQNETSITAVILPHYIIGLEVFREGKLHINPNIFSNPINKSIFFEGLNINQDTFRDIIQKTNYASYFATDGRDYSDIDISS